MRFRQSLFAIIFAAAPLVAQNLGSVEGKVVNSTTGEGVKKAVVTVRNANGQFTYFTASDQSGKFHIDNMQPEKYVATADAEGYSNMRGPNGFKPFTLSAGQAMTGVNVAIPPLSVIAGKVLDDNNEPLDGVNVMAMRYAYTSGAKTLQQASNAQTDDRGQFRIFDVQPGRYYLAASAGNRAFRQIVAPQGGSVTNTIPEEAYGVLIYPGVADVSQATAHDIKPGAEWAGADFKLHKRPAYHIRGRINGPTLPGGGRGNIQVQPCNPEPMPSAGLPNMGMRPDGSFDFSGAIPGTYCLLLREPSRGGLAVRQEVTVKEGDVNNVVLTPPEPISVSGTVVIEGTAPAHMPNLGISLRTPDGNQQMHAQVKSDMTFTIDNVFPGKHTIVLPGGNQMYVKSILYGSQDVSSGVIPDIQPGASLTITMASDMGEIDGTVQVGTLESGTPLMLVAAPDDAHAARSDMFRIITGSAEGTFVLPGLAPGDYKVFALEGQDYQDTQNRDLLKLLESKASAVTVHAGGHEQVSLTPVSAAEMARAKERL